MAQLPSAKLDIVATDSPVPEGSLPDVAVLDPARRGVEVLSGVGPAVLLALHRLQLRTLQDLWFHLPLRYEDRTRVVPIADLRPGDTAQVEGCIEAVEQGFRNRPQLRIAIADAGRQTLVLRFFHFHRAQLKLLTVGTRLRCYGEARHGAQGLEMVHPQYERLSEASRAVAELLSPIYPTTEGLGQKRLGGLIEQALQRLPDDGALELIPAALRSALGHGSLREALLYVHQPPPDADLASLALGQHPAQRRLAFEELLSHHLSLKRLRAQVRQHRAPVLRGGTALRKALLAALPFKPTRAQSRVSAEIAVDLKRPAPMLRLVQGDVGSGKTLVAALAALTAIQSGWQVALMAPTELLAEQHWRTFSQWFEPLGLELVWLSGKVQGVARRNALAATAGGAAMVIGTHALMQEGIEFSRLGLAIIDEQHRFGVHQRLALRDKGRDGTQVPHQLVLTATPIPRTLAMTAYADLDVSVIDELPPGRTPVATVAISSARREQVIERIRLACAEGRQAYWVCTLIDETEQLQAQAAQVVFAELCIALPGLAVGLVHGRLKAKEKLAVMDAFKAGQIALLVATTVIEVGVDVPNASLMVIENAERLGLAQLHQLRGRVGRGTLASSCVLLYRAPLSGLARDRLEVLRQTNDGFVVAEKDLQLRGPGEVLGTRQTGQLNLRIADVQRDADLLPAVHEVGEVMLTRHPDLAEQLVARWIGASAQYAAA